MSKDYSEIPFSEYDWNDSGYVEFFIVAFRVAPFGVKIDSLDEKRAIFDGYQHTAEEGIKIANELGNDSDLLEKTLKVMARK